MELIHTSDWHLSQLFHGYERTDEDPSRAVIPLTVNRATASGKRTVWL